MSNEIEDGGSAFPYEWKEWDYDDRKWKTQFIHTGMTLRDYFAAKAMQGWLSTYSEDLEAEQAELGSAIVARLAYAMADAMLKARQS